MSCSARAAGSSGDRERRVASLVSAHGGNLQRMLAGGGCAQDRVALLRDVMSACELAPVSARRAYIGVRIREAPAPPAVTASAVDAFAKTAAGRHAGADVARLAVEWAHFRYGANRPAGDADLDGRRAPHRLTTILILHTTQPNPVLL